MLSPLCHVMCSHVTRYLQELHMNVMAFFNSLFSLHQRKYQSCTLLTPYRGKPPVSGGFPSQRASDAESVSRSWRHHISYNRISRFTCISYNAWHLRSVLLVPTNKFLPLSLWTSVCFMVLITLLNHNAKNYFKRGVKRTSLWNMNPFQEHVSLAL